MTQNVLACQWMALCENPATLAGWGPIGDGAWGYIPVCERCNGRFGLDALPAIIEYVEE